MSFVSHLTKAFVLDQQKSTPVELNALSMTNGYPSCEGAVSALFKAGLMEKGPPGTLPWKFLIPEGTPEKSW